MSLSRRDFLKWSGTASGGVLAGTRGVDLAPVEAAATDLRIKEAKVFPGVCPYCAVGCAQLIYVKDGKIVDIEGDPDTPHTEGALCPKGSSTYQLSVNARRLTKPMYRAAGSDRWEEKPLDWMMEQIAQRVKKTRDASFVETVTPAPPKVDALPKPEAKDPRSREPATRPIPRRPRLRAPGKPITVNRCEGIAWLGSSVLDNEENYLIAKLSRGLGLVNLENSARLCHSATVPALGATFGRGAMTTNLIDVINADVIMPTSNWAECHPVSYKWVMKAKERGAKIIHVDPRFTRTSATADIWVPIRSGTNIVYFGGLIRYAIESKKYFHDYVVAYTNASLLLDPALQDPGRPRRALQRLRRRQASLRPGELEVPAGRRWLPEAGQDPPGSELRLPAAPTALRALHAGDGREGVRDPEGPVPQGGRHLLLGLGARQDGHRILRAPAQPVDQRGPADPRALHAAARSSATSDVRVAAWWPSGVTRTSRGPRTSGRSITCCRAIRRSRSRRPPHPDRLPREDDAQGRLLGEQPQVRDQPPQGLVGARGHEGERLRLRLPPEAGEGGRVLPPALHRRNGPEEGDRVHLPWARTRRWTAPTPAWSARGSATSTGWSSSTCSRPRPPPCGRRRASTRSPPRPRSSSSPARRRRRRTARSPTPCASPSGT